MPDQGNALGALMPEEPGWTYGELLPLRSRQSAAGPEMELAWPGAVRSVVNGLGALMGGMDAPQGLSDNPDPLQAATGGRLEAQAENPLLAMALRGIGARGDPNELGIFAGVHGRKGPSAPGDWFTGVDELPRFEISDYPASLRPGGVPPVDALIHSNTGRVTRYLGDVLDHPELYEQYPELKKMRVQFDANLEPGMNGMLYPNNKIVVNPFRWDKKTIGGVEYDTPRRATDEELISTILHEGQHQVQTIEGFAGGSNVDAVAQQLHWAKQYLAQKALEAKSPSEFLEYGKQAGQIDKLLEQADPYGLYKDTAGEVEARNVQTRRQHSLIKGPAARYLASPEATEDVPRSRQLLLPSRPPEGFDFRQPMASVSPPATLKPISAGDAGYTPKKGEEYYSFTTPEGHAGTLVVALEGNNAHVVDIYSGAGPRVFGAQAMRQVLEQFQQLHPEVQTVTGERNSGARFGGKYGVSGALPGEGTPVKLRLKPVDHDPFGHIMVPVEHDPFAPALVPVDHDPFGGLGDELFMASAERLPPIEAGKKLTAANPETDQQREMRWRQEATQKIRQSKHDAISSLTDAAIALKKAGHPALSNYDVAAGGIFQLVRQNPEWTNTLDIDPNRSLQEKRLFDAAAKFKALFPPRE